MTVISAFVPLKQEGSVLMLELSREQLELGRPRQTLLAAPSWWLTSCRCSQRLSTVDSTFQLFTEVESVEES
jgi:hypothetical protein